MTGPAEPAASRARVTDLSKVPTVITRAELPYDEQVRLRRRKYLIMMGMRIPLLVAGAACYQTPWLGILLVLISIPLPWCAVLIANDRPARKGRRVVPGTINHERALPPGQREIVDSDST